MYYVTPAIKKRSAFDVLIPFSRVLLLIAIILDLVARYLIYRIFPNIEPRAVTIFFILHLLADEAIFFVAIGQPNERLENSALILTLISAGIDLLFFLPYTLIFPVVGSLTIHILSFGGVAVALIGLVLRPDPTNKPIPPLSTLRTIILITAVNATLSVLGVLLVALEFFSLSWLYLWLFTVWNYLAANAQIGQPHVGLISIISLISAITLAVTTAILFTAPAPDDNAIEAFISVIVGFPVNLDPIFSVVRWFMMITSFVLYVLQAILQSVSIIAMFTDVRTWEKWKQNSKETALKIKNAVEGALQREKKKK